MILASEELQHLGINENSKADTTYTKTSNHKAEMKIMKRLPFLLQQPVKWSE